MFDYEGWRRRDETEQQHDQRVVQETGEVVRKDCLRLAKKHNGWILSALRADRQSIAELYYRMPEDWKRDLEGELEWLMVLGLANRSDEGWWYAAD